MSYIAVNHNSFETAARAIDGYLSDMQTKMNSANSEVNNLAASWQGKDYTQFQSQWNTVTNSSSTYMNMRRALESYAKYLRYAGNKYKTAQADAVNRANSLPRW